MLEIISLKLFLVNNLVTVDLDLGLYDYIRRFGIK